MKGRSTTNQILKSLKDSMSKDRYNYLNKDKIREEILLRSKGLRYGLEGTTHRTVYEINELPGGYHCDGHHGFRLHTGHYGKEPEAHVCSGQAHFQCITPCQYQERKAGGQTTRWFRHSGKSNFRGDEGHVASG
jgi:hypothetical protein